MGKRDLGVHLSDVVGSISPAAAQSSRVKSDRSWLWRACERERGREGERKRGRARERGRGGELERAEKWREGERERERGEGYIYI